MEDVIAVIGVDDANGTWQYDTGSGWTAFGAVANNNATLLNPGASVRFVPDADYDGSATITFRAWDQSSGSNGDTGVDVSTNGSTTAYSTATETAAATTPLDCGNFPLPVDSSATGIAYDVDGINDLEAYRV